MRLIIIGPPGSGKGTVAEKLEREFHLAHISPGELLREEVQQSTRLGQQIKKYINKGSLVPDQFVVEMVKLELGGKKNFILDGFPRTMAQAQAIQDIKVDAVIYLTLPLSKVIERLSGRRVCRAGHHNYHLNYLPPKKKGVCDIDTTPLIQRKDDTPSAVKERFRIYTHETKPVVHYYAQQEVLVTIDAAVAPEKVYSLVKKALKSLSP